MQPIVDVVTVCRNERESIARCVDSVLRQSYGAVRHVVIDGASDDGTVEVLEGYRGSLHHLVSEPDGGIYAAMNKALSVCGGEVVYFLNADDYFFADDTVERAAERFAARPDLDLLAGCVRFFNTPVRDGVPYERTDFSFRSKLDLYRSPIPQQCIFARRALFDVLGGFDVRYRMCADFEWLIRALDRGVSVAHTEQCFCHFDYCGISFTENDARKREKNLIVLRNSSMAELARYVAAGVATRLRRMPRGFR